MAREIDLEHLSQWTGRQEVLEERLGGFPMRALKATLEADYAGDGEDGEELPPLWHWLYFLPLAPQSELGPDGHPRRGGFLPPVELPRRMWAGGRFGFMEPLHIGERVRRTSTIWSVKGKQGRNGPLVFVTVRHQFEVGGAVRMWEEHDIVYRGEARSDAAEPAVATLGPGIWRRRVMPDEVLLFRYSALTFNGHRIHYDRRYATEVEGYPGLVVHGPLIATLLLDLAQRECPKLRLSAFSFRAQRPLFDRAPLEVCGEPSDSRRVLRLWACDEQGRCAMDATASLA